MWPDVVRTAVKFNHFPLERHWTGNFTNGEFSKGQRLYFLQLNDICKTSLVLKLTTSIHIHTPYTHTNPMS